MERAGGFLDKYKNLTPPDGVMRQAVTDVLNNTFGTSISVDVVHVRNNVVWLEVSPAIKNTVAIYKNELITQLQEQLGTTHAPTDIR